MHRVKIWVNYSCQNMLNLYNFYMSLDYPKISWCCHNVDWWNHRTTWGRQMQIKLHNITIMYRTGLTSGQWEFKICCLFVPWYSRMTERCPVLLQPRAKVRIYENFLLWRISIILKKKKKMNVSGYSTVAQSNT